MATITLPDPYEGWSEDQLKDRLRALGSAVMNWELIAANMGAVPEALAMLDPASRQKVKRIMDAYTD
jgi:hypothetical protein